MSGWVKIHRSVQSNRIWNSEPFSRGQAWIDLILLANHEPGVIYVRDHRIEIERGQVGWSENRLSERWGWSRTKVRKFLKDLEKEQQIRQEKSRSYGIINIENYDYYQTEKQEKKQQKNNRKTTEKQQKNTNKNVKNGKNEKNINIPFSEFWDLYDKKKGSKPNAEKMWNNLSDSERQEIMRLLPGYVSSFSEKKYQPHPTTFLNQRRWESEDEMKPDQEMRIYA